MWIHFHERLLLLIALFTTPSWGWVPTADPSSRRPPMTTAMTAFATAEVSVEETASYVVQNARMAAGLAPILRCASTDGLGEKIAVNNNNKRGPFDAIILEQAGLVFDLRSPSERNQSQAQAWMEAYQFNAKELDAQKQYTESQLQSLLEKNPRLVCRLDILSPSRFMAHLEENWLLSTQKIQANLFKVVDGNKLHALRMETLNQRGLAGLNEAILETGQQGICTALQLLTLYMEKLSNDNSQQQQDETTAIPYYDVAVVHCVQGKDRTGLLVMLCQSMMGISDETIIHDYYQSHYAGKRRPSQPALNGNGNDSQETSAAMERAASSSSGSTSKGKLDRSIFHAAPPHVMEETLAYLRSRYGSVAPGYLNHIGFDETWQIRFGTAMAKVNAEAKNGGTNNPSLRSML